MADYSHHDAYRVARRLHEAGAQRLGWLLATLAVLMVAILAWVWTQQRFAQPQPQPASAYRPQVAAPAPVRTTPIPTPLNAAVAAAGDTRPVR